MVADKTLQNIALKYDKKNFHNAFKKLKERKPNVDILTFLNLTIKMLRILRTMPICFLKIILIRYLYRVENLCKNI